MLSLSNCLALSRGAAVVPGVCRAEFNLIYISDCTLAQIRMEAVASAGSNVAAPPSRAEQLSDAHTDCVDPAEGWKSLPHHKSGQEIWKQLCTEARENAVRTAASGCVTTSASPGMLIVVT